MLQAGGGNDSLPALRGRTQLQGQDSNVSQPGWRCENGWLEENRRGSGYPWADTRPLKQVDCTEIRGSNALRTLVLEKATQMPMTFPLSYGHCALYLAFRAQGCIRDADCRRLGLVRCKHGCPWSECGCSCICVHV